MSVLTGVTLTLPLSVRDGTWHCVEAEFVDVAPHLASVATFALHGVSGVFWQVSNIETGMAVGFRRESIDDALLCAAELLSAESESRILRLLEEIGDKRG